MTMMQIEDVTCFYCHQHSEQVVMTSTNEFGSRDLDFRPAPMRRSTMSSWLQECQHCHYVAPEIDSETNNPEVIDSEVYKGLFSNTLFSSLAKRFLAYALLVEKDEPIKAGYATLKAAWVCDDKEKPALAVLCRSMAILKFDSFNYQCDAEQQPTNNMVTVDMLRRNGNFDDAQVLVKRLLSDSNISSEILEILVYQEKLLESQDSESHSLSDSAKFRETNKAIER